MQTIRRRSPNPLAQTARLFLALSQPNRLDILDLLRSNDALSVTEIGERMNFSQPTASHHLRILRKAGLISTRRRGLWVYASLAEDARDIIEEAVNRVLPG